MKNKEKIQILVNRLNTHAELLDKIITKLELDNEPQLKQIDQSVFDGLDEKWQFAVVQNNGFALICTQSPFLAFGGSSWDWNGYSDAVGKGYDASNWQTSLIERETIELTGSELCKAMLARGDTRIMCKVYDIDYHHDITHVIRSYSNGKFHTKANSWTYAVPINNQGEPLTSKDVGL